MSTFSTPTTLSPTTQREIATLMHGACIPMGILSPVLAYVFLRDRGNLLRRNIIDALNFQITLFSALGLAWALSLIPGIVGLILAILSPLISLIAIILIAIAAVQTYRGKDHHYPLTIRFFN